MKLFRLFFIISLSIVCSHSTFAQSFSWEMPLSDCTSLQRIWTNLFEMTKDGKKGVVDSQGNVKVPIENTEITKFHDGVALVLSSNRIVGLLDSIGVFNKFDSEYFTLDGQEFFSDGYLTVMNKKGQKGYIDFDGNPMGFERKYTRIKPFTEGYAAVFHGNQFSLVDKNLVAIPIKIGIGTVTRGTNMYNGKSVVWDSDGLAYEVSPTSTRRNRQYDFNNLKDRRFDYLHRLIGVAKSSIDVVWDKMNLQDFDVLPSKDSHGYYGLKNIIPFQFDFAEHFYGNLAVVRKNDKWGVLKINRSDEHFRFNGKQHYFYKEGGAIDCNLQYTDLPKVWRNKNIYCTILDSKSKIICDSRMLQNGRINFSVEPSKNIETFTILLSSEELVLCEDDLTIEFEKLKDLQASIKILNSKAKEDDKCYVQISIKNINKVSNSAEISIEGSGSLHKLSTSTEIKPNGILEIKTWFHVPNRILNNQIIRIREDGKIIAEKNIPRLDPFYTGE